MLTRFHTSRPATRRTTPSLAAAAVMAMAGTFAMTASAIAAPDVGAPAPEFSAVNTKGETINLKDLRGSTVILEWTNHDCPYVKKHYETSNMQNLQKRATDEGVVWLSVISSAKGTQGHVSSARADELTQKRDAAPTHVLLDESGAVGRMFDARTTPHMYVIDAEGMLQYRGAIDDKPSTRRSDVETATNYVNAALEAVKAGKSPDPAVTRAYGCSVKYGS